MLVVGLSARKQGGKNTSARHIREHFQYMLFGQTDVKVMEYAYADVLKQMCMDLFGLSYAQCYGTDAEKNTATKLHWVDMPTFNEREFRGNWDVSMSGREVLQYFGTEIVRKMFSNAWVDATLRKIQKESPDIALVTDVRFPNEVEGIHLLSGKVLRLLRAPCTEDEHESERALDPEVFDWHQFDAVLDNRIMTIEEQRRPVVDQVLYWYSSDLKI